MMWLRTKDDDLVNMDRVAIVNVYQRGYSRPVTSCVDAMIQVTSNEDHQVSAVLFESASLWSCQDFIRWLYQQLATGARVADVTDYLAAVTAEEVQ